MCSAMSKDAVAPSPPAPRTSAAAIERARQRVLAVLALPALALLTVLFAYPVLRLMTLSMEGGSFAWYAKALGESLYLEVFWITIRIALTVTLAALVLSYPLAYFLATTTRLGAALGFALVILPLWTSILVRTYAWMVLLGRNGVVNKSLIALGAIDEPLALLHNELGVVIGMVHVLMPYMVLPVYAAMRRVRTCCRRRRGSAPAPFAFSAACSCRSRHRGFMPGAFWYSFSPSASSSRRRCSAAGA
jgi:ABC-type spermidine/putrescine transport system permease subunit I